MITCDAPDGKPLYRVADATDSEIGCAIEKAKAARSVFRQQTGQAVSLFLNRISAGISSNSSELVRSIVLETGKPISQALSEVEGSERVLSNYASIARSPSNANVHLNYSEHVQGVEVREPRGVALVVTPWNFPLQVICHKVAAALVARCPVVLKPSPLSVQTAKLFCAIAKEAGLPDEWLQIIFGGADPVHAAIAQGVDIVSFTGGASGGQAVARSAASRTIPCILELGGRNPAIVLSDSANDRAASAIVRSIVRNQGASCTSTVRVLVAKSQFDSFCHDLKKAIQSCKVGDPFVSATDVGAIRTSQLRDSIMQVATDTERLGASVIVPPRVVEVSGRTGAYLSPGLFVSSPATRIIEEDEIFGPLATVSSFEDREEALYIANNSPYGLSAAVWSHDPNDIAYFTTHLEYGSVHVNHSSRIENIPLATSGRRMSGYGEEGGTLGVKAFQASKSVHYSV